MPRTIPSMTTVAKCPLNLAHCNCIQADCECATTRKTSNLCESQLMPWMLEYNRKAPEHLRLPFEIWAMVLDHLRDREGLAARRKKLVRTSRFSARCDLLDLARIYEVVNELDYFFEYRL